MAYRRKAILKNIANRSVDLRRSICVLQPILFRPSSISNYYEYPNQNLDSANFIGLIQDAHNVQLKKVDRTIECTTFPNEINLALNLPKKNKGVLVQIKATGTKDSPIFFQQLFLPADGPKLFFGQNGFY